jgi:hypothetical protein
LDVSHGRILARCGSYSRHASGPQKSDFVESCSTR